MSFVWLNAGPRSVLLFKLAYEEEGLTCPDVDERVAPVCILYPRSFVDSANALSGDKKYDYSFMGSLYRPEILEAREWILEFARQRFTDESFLQLSQSPPEHRNMGSFDHTGDDHGVWVPKDVPWLDRDFFNPIYFGILRQSRFALCPAGDMPWSNRFFEAIMCRSIPIISDRLHAGRHDLERSIGYHAYMPGDEHIYDEEIVEENYNLFLEHQTLIGSEKPDS